MKKLLSLVISAVLALSAGIAVSASDIGECKGEVPKIDTGIITVDGVKDSAYEKGLKVDINQFNAGAETGTYGIAYMLWADGSYYLLVEVHDADVQQPTADAQANTPWTTDSVEIFFDFGNEAVDLAEQFRIDCTGYPSYYIQGGAYYAYGPEDAAEYFDDYAASKTDVGYNIEMRVNLKEAVEAYELAQGDSIGLQLQINDMTAANATGTTAVYNMASSLLAGSWDVDRYDYITLGGTVTVEADAPAADAAAEAVYLDYTSTDVIAESTGAFATVEEAAASIGKTPITSGYTFVAGTNGFNNEGPENLFDNDTATKFCTGEFPTIAVAKLDTPVTVDGVIMATANDNASYAGRNPFEWAVFVSADGANWTQLVYGDDTFLEDTNFTYYGTAVTPVENVQYVQFQSEGALAGCFQVSEFVLCGTESAAAPAEEPASKPAETAAPATEPVAETAEETVEVPAATEAPAETPVETTAPQTFDMGVIAAVCAVISAAGYAVSKKRR